MSAAIFNGLFRQTLALFFSASIGLSSASSFLSRAQEASVMELTPELEASISQEIEHVLSGSSRGVAEDRLIRIQDMLRSTFKSLPKTPQGKLHHAAVRYSLHSYFVQRHAWYVRGLSGDMSNTSSPTTILQDKVEDFVQAAFEQRMGTQGLDLRDVAVLAATYENLVHKEMSQRLDATRNVMNMTGQESMTVAEMDQVLDVYMMGYILNLNYTVVLPEQLQIIRNSITQIYPTWGTTQSFLRTVRDTHSLHKSFFSRSDVEVILEEVFDQYGHWQDRECQDLKKQLLAIEDKSIGVNGSGRVKLTDFYGSALHDGNWQFSENTHYLAQNGALDTHGGERVIIANYINSPSNCLASSKFYSVCCVNECEKLMDHIEHHFAAPTATTDEIIRFISSLSSSSVAAGRTLHELLVQRLEQIAARYEGQVPLHGRLFAQWMHHAYPRECAYPHISGTTRPQTVSDYVMQSQRSPVVTKDQMKLVLEQAQSRQGEVGDKKSEECTEWSNHEEMYVVDNRVIPEQLNLGLWKQFRPFVFLSAIAASFIALSQRRNKKNWCGDKDLYV